MILYYYANNAQSQLLERLRAIVMQQWMDFLIVLHVLYWMISVLPNAVVVNNNFALYQAYVHSRTNSAKKWDVGHNYDDG